MSAQPPLVVPVRLALQTIVRTPIRGRGGLESRADCASPTERSVKRPPPHPSAPQFQGSACLERRTPREERGRALRWPSSELQAPHAPRLQDPGSTCATCGLRAPHPVGFMRPRNVSAIIAPGRPLHHCFHPEEGCSINCCRGLLSK